MDSESKEGIMRKLLFALPIVFLAACGQSSTPSASQVVGNSVGHSSELGSYQDYLIWLKQNPSEKGEPKTLTPQNRPACFSSANWDSGHYHYTRLTDYYGNTTLLVQGDGATGYYSHTYYYSDGC